MIVKKGFSIALIFTFWAGLSLPAKAEKCVALPLVGGEGTEVEKTITTPSIPGPFGIKVTTDNWNTDWAIPNSKKFNSYRATIVSEEGGNFIIKMYLKYSDDTADSFYDKSETTLSPKQPLIVNTKSSREEQPYQLNIFVGGVQSIGNKYKATVFGCQ